MDNLPLTIETHPGAKSGQIVMALSGPLTLFNLFAFQGAVRAEKSPVVILDLGGVPYMDSAGLGAVINAHISCTNSGRRLALIAVADRVMTMIRVARLDEVIKIFPTLQEAQDQLA